MLIGINLLPSEHFLRLPIGKKMAEPIALDIKQAILLAEKVMHLQRDGHQGTASKESKRNHSVQVRTKGKLNEEKARIQSGRCSKIKVEIEEAEEKVRVMQAQTSVIKCNAQFKKVANL
jgi:hypothetical protein